MIMPRSVVGLLTLLLSIPGPAAAQVADPKSAFVDAFTQFSFALEGAHGDEGARILSSLDALDQGLTQWDAAIRGYEAAVAGQPKDADPKLAGLAHMALGGIYLDRGRVADALREFPAPLCGVFDCRSGRLQPAGERPPEGGRYA